MIPGYENIDTDLLGKVRIMDSMGVLRGGFLLLDPNKDRMGLATVYSPGDGIILKVHPDRIQSDEMGGSMAVVDRGKAIAVCPHCGEVCAVKDGAGECDCGDKFGIAGTIESQTNSQPVKKKSPSESVDLETLASHGEIWTQEVKFDDGKTRVVSVSLRVGNRYLSFNLYNGSFGKKGTQPPISQLIAGLEVGYLIDDIDKWHKKLIKKGYTAWI